jgi:hypothetical protein
MSILNHFGKVKSSYKKYNSDLPEYKGYVFKQHKSHYNMGADIERKRIKCIERDITLFNFIDDIWKYPSIIGNGIVTEPTNCINAQFSFTNLVETFSKCYHKVREKMYSELWKTLDCCPFINIIDLLILKQNDTDKHIEHLEEIVKALIDDNKLLQTKINSLESQMSLFKIKIPIAVAVESTSNSCEKTVAEEILYELD